MMKYLIILIPSLVFGQFTNFPLENHYTNADWNLVNQECHPLQQLYSGIVERVNLINNGGSYLDPVQIVKDNAVYAGKSNAVFTVGGWTYTNTYVIISNVVTTNCFTNYQYTYTDMEGTHTNTLVPTLTREEIYDIDYYLWKLCGDWGGGWFVNPTSDLYSAWMQGQPYSAYQDQGHVDMGAMMYYKGIGHTDVTYTNGSHNQVTSAESYFTKGFATTGRWSLATGRYLTNGTWATTVHRDTPARFYETVPPVVQWSRGDTNAFRPVSLRVQGSDDVTYSVTSTNFALDRVWTSVTSISSTDGSANSNDTYEVVYTNRFLVYDASLPFDPFGTEDTYWGSARMLDDRYRLITNLFMTVYKSEDLYPGYNWRHPGMLPFNRGWNFRTLNWGDYFYPYDPDPIGHFLADWNAPRPSANWDYRTNENVGASIWLTASADGYGFIYLINAQSIFDAEEGVQGIPTNVCSRFDYHYYRYCGVNQIAYSGNYAPPYNPDYLLGDKVYSGTETDLVDGTNRLIVPLTFWQNKGSTLSAGDAWDKRVQYQVMYFDWRRGLKWK